MVTAESPGCYRCRAAQRMGRTPARRVSFLRPGETHVSKSERKAWRERSDTVAEEAVAKATADAESKGKKLSEDAAQKIRDAAYEAQAKR